MPMKGQKRSAAAIAKAKATMAARRSPGHVVDMRIIPAPAVPEGVDPGIPPLSDSETEAIAEQQMALRERLLGLIVGAAPELLHSAEGGAQVVAMAERFMRFVWEADAA